MVISYDLLASTLIPSNACSPPTYYAAVRAQQFVGVACFQHYRSTPNVSESKMGTELQAKYQKLAQEYAKVTSPNTQFVS